MNELILNFIKVNIAITSFYLIYKVFYSKDTFLETKRLFWNASIMFTIAVPYIRLPEHISENSLRLPLPANTYLPELIISPEQPNFDWISVGINIYLIISLLLFGRYLLGIYQIVHLRFHSQKKQWNNTAYYAVSRDIKPFSFFGWIFINEHTPSKKGLDEILAHETVHCKGGHSWDVLGAELIQAITWINPVSWLIASEIRNNLEYLADRKVIGRGFERKTYQYHLLSMQGECPDIHIANHFNKRTIKKRIAMMNKKKNNKPAAAKYLLAVPLALGLVLYNNSAALASNSEVRNDAKTESTELNTATPDLTQNAKESKTVKSGVTKIDEISVVGYGVSTKSDDSKEKADSKSAQGVNSQKEDKTIFMVVEEMPEYPGGIQNLMKFLMENVKYPVSAQENKIQGRVFCQFVIDTDGTPTDIKVVRSVDPALDAEAMRVIGIMPKWKPGMQRGQKVRVQYTLPINFSLMNDGKSKPASAINDLPNPVIFVDGERMPDNFNLKIIDSNKIATIDVRKATTDEEKASLIKMYGDKADKGVILIMTKKDDTAPALAK